MRAAAIFGLGCSPKQVKPFQVAESLEWRIGMPAAADEADVILVFGGDGTIHRHLSPLVRLGLPVLVVPAGSGNDFARALGLRRVRDSLRAWRGFCAGEGNVSAIDLGVVTAPAVAGGAPAPHGHYFCSVAGVGLDGEVSRRANTLPRWLRGHGGYAISLVPAIFGFAALPVKIFAPDNSGDWKARSDQPTVLAAFANTSSYGGGMKIAPHARMDDGLLDVCVVGGIDPFKLFCMFPAIYFGRHLGIRGVEHFQAARLRVETETPLDVYADGEFVCRTPVEVSLQPRALKVITP
jgi:diacylglycerol kinase (ATP)